MQFRKLTAFRAVIAKYQQEFLPVIPFDPTSEQLLVFDFSKNSREPSPDEISDTDKFSGYVTQKLSGHGAKYGIGGYGEHRMLYARSPHFNTGEEPRRLHLGCDVWGPAGTKVMAPLDGIVHSFAFNNHDSDYGATIILTHNLQGISFHTLYGHLSLNSLKNLHQGKRVLAGEAFSEFGMRFENGNWPAHLHFQIILDMGDFEGDYPGVCRFSEKEHWLGNSPDPDCILQLYRHTRKNDS